MPAYSFKEQFCPFVIDGTKPHTVRDRRKNPAAKGDDLHLYYAMRTKYCTKLRQEICSNTVSLSISLESGVVLYNQLLPPEYLAIAKRAPLSPNLKQFDPYILYSDQLDAFAWLDGFRVDGSSLIGPDGCFELMEKYWQSANGFNWAGDIIFWNSKVEHEKVYPYIKQFSGYY